LRPGKVGMGRSQRCFVMYPFPFSFFLVLSLSAPIVDASLVGFHPYLSLFLFTYLISPPLPFFSSSVAFCAYVNYCTPHALIDTNIKRAGYLLHFISLPYLTPLIPQVHRAILKYLPPQTLSCTRPTVLAFRNIGVGGGGKLLEACASGERPGTSMDIMMTVQA
jgi:hypothetical protein